MCVRISGFKQSNDDDSYVLTAAPYNGLCERCFYREHVCDKKYSQTKITLQCKRTRGQLCKKKPSPFEHVVSRSQECVCVNEIFCVCSNAYY